MEEIVQAYYFLDRSVPSQRTIQHFKTKLTQYYFLRVGGPHVLDEEMTKIADCVKKAELLVLDPAYQAALQAEKRYKRHKYWIFAVPLAVCIVMGGLFYGVILRTVSILGFVLGVIADIGVSLALSGTLQRCHQRGSTKREQKRNALGVALVLKHAAAMRFNTTEFPVVSLPIPTASSVTQPWVVSEA